MSEADVSAIQTKITDVKELATSLKKAQATMLAKNSKPAKEEVDRITKQVTIALKGVTEDITAFEESIRGDKSAPLAEKRAKLQQAKTLREQVIAITGSVQTGQESHEGQKVSATEQRLKARFGDHADDVAAKRLAQELVRQRREDQLFMLARNELESAIETHQEVLQIESNVRELSDLMKHLQLMVEKQSEEIQEADRRLELGNDNMRRGNEAMDEANKIGCAVM